MIETVCLPAAAGGEVIELAFCPNPHSEMPAWLSISIAFVGCSLLLLAIAQLITKLRHATSRSERIEAIGVLSPGIAGALLVVAIVIESPVLSLSLCAAALPLLLFGRAGFELLLDRIRQDRKA